VCTQALPHDVTMSMMSQCHNVMVHRVCKMHHGICLYA